jgi:hypothetical protein
MHSSTKVSGTLPHAICLRQAGSSLGGMPVGGAPMAPPRHHRSPCQGPAMRARMQGRGVGADGLPSAAGSSSGSLRSSASSPTAAKRSASAAETKAVRSTSKGSTGTMAGGCRSQGWSTGSRGQAPLTPLVATMASSSSRAAGVSGGADHVTKMTSMRARRSVWSPRVSRPDHTPKGTKVSLPASKCAHTAPPWSSATARLSTRCLPEPLKRGKMPMTGRTAALANWQNRSTSSALYGGLPICHSPAGRPSPQTRSVPSSRAHASNEAPHAASDSSYVKTFAQGPVRLSRPVKSSVISPPK